MLGGHGILALTFHVNHLIIFVSYFLLSGVLWCSTNFLSFTAGIRNLGNTCYFGAVATALTHSGVTDSTGEYHTMTHLCRHIPISILKSAYTCNCLLLLVLLWQLDFLCAWERFGKGELALDVCYVAI